MTRILAAPSVTADAINERAPIPRIDAAERKAGVEGRGDGQVQGTVLCAD